MLIAAYDAEWQRRAGVFLDWPGCGCRDINRFWHWVRLRSHGTLNLMCSVTTDEWPHYRIIERQIHLELVRAHSLARGMRRTRYDHIPPSGVLNRCREHEHGLIMWFDSTSLKCEPLAVRTNGRKQNVRCVTARTLGLQQWYRMLHMSSERAAIMLTCCILALAWP